MMMIVGIMVLLQGAMGGSIRGREINGCVCREEGEGLRLCDGDRAGVLSVEDCPGVQLWKGNDFLVTDLKGWASQVQFMRTTMTCGEFPSNTSTILNGRRCVSIYFFFIFLIYLFIYLICKSYFV